MGDQKYYDIMKDAFIEVDMDGAQLKTLPESYLWKTPLINMLTALHYADLQLPGYASFLFTGPSGCGKHTTAEALVRSIAAYEEMADQTFVLTLRADDFRLSSNEETQKCMDEIFEAAADTEGLRIIIFDQMERYRHRTAFMNRLADYLPDPGMQDEDDIFAGGRLFVICITEDDRSIMRELRKKLMCCRVVLPGEAEREQYLKAGMTFTVEDWNYPDTLQYRTIHMQADGIGLDELVRRSEGYSYLELEGFISAVRMHVSGMSFGMEPTTDITLDKNLVLQFLKAARTEQRTFVRETDAAGTGALAAMMQMINAGTFTNPSAVHGAAGVSGTAPAANIQKLMEKPELSVTDAWNIIDSIPTRND